MVGSMIVAAIAGTTAAGVAASFALTAAAFAVNFVVSTIVTRMFAPDMDQGPQNNREQIPPTTDNAIPVVYGDAYLGGTFVDAALSTNQQTMYYVLAVSCISPNGQFAFDTTKFYYGGRLITFGSSPNQSRVVSLTDDAGNVDTSIDNNLWIYLYTSNAAGTITPINTTLAPHQVMSSSTLAPAFVWPSTGRQMNGLAFAIVRLDYHAQEGFNQLQPITFKVAHTLNSTGVAKPGDVWYDYMTNSVYGCAVPSAYVDSASATTLNTYADATIAYTPSGGGSATQARYRINGVLSGNISALDNVEKILNCCDTWMTYNAASGQWALVVNKAETAAYAFNDSNIVGEIRVSATDITQSVNQIEARFPFKENKDQSNFVFLQTPAALLYPNEPVNKTSVTYELVNDSVQAQYLANRVLEQAREDLIVSFNTTYYGIQVEAGEVVSVTNTDYGWSAKLFRVMKVNEVALPDGNLGARLELSEYSAAVYDDATITQYAPVPNSGILSPGSFSALSAPTILASRPSATVPSFDVRCVLPAVGQVNTVILYGAYSATPALTDWFEISRQTVIDGSLLTPGANFDFLNISLPANTYYLSFVVANDSGVSGRSATSSAFVWAPIATSTATQEADLIIYQWTNTTPAMPTGTSTYTWATQSFLPPTGWTLLPGMSPGNAYALVSATIKITALFSDTTTTVNWSQSRLLLTETNATSTYSPRIAFARIGGTVNLTYGTITTTGTASFPSAAQSSTTWSVSATWTAADPDPTSSSPLYRIDGTYNSATNNIVWTTPYIAALRVGTLSALSTDTGDLNVSGNITMDTYGAIKGGQTDFNTGTGFFVGYSSTAYKFSIGNASNSLTWDGSELRIVGTLKAGSNNSLTIGPTGVVTVWQLIGPNAQFTNTNNGGAAAIAVTNTFSTSTTPLISVTANTTNTQFGINVTNGGVKSTVGTGADAALSGDATVANVHGVRGVNSAGGTSGLVGAGNGYDFYADGSGTNYGPFTGAHDALIYKTDAVSIGDIVVDVECIARKNVSNTIFRVANSSTANQARAIGIVAVPTTDLTAESAPTALDVDSPDFPMLCSTCDVLGVNAVGEGQINVCGEGGDIQAGDLIVTSSVPGKGMKQADDVVRSITVAKARESVTFASPTEVKMIACIYLCG